LVREATVMKKVDVVIVGGSAAGLTSAITCKRHYPKKSVVLIRKEAQVLVPCGIPYIFGTVGRPEKNLISDTILDKNNIELLVDEVTEIDPSRRIVDTVKKGKFAYERLVIATGSRPFIPKIPGTRLKNIFFVKKSVSHLRQMLNQLARSSNLVIVGGGFIGAEFADECRKKRNIRITIIELLPHCLMLNFDVNYCAVAEKIEKEHGVKILAPERVEAFLGNGAVEGVELATGGSIDADMVILSVGSVANNELAENAGLTIGPRNGILVDQYMRTSDENVFACGDCAEKFSFFDGQPCSHKLASIATKEARIAGANLFYPHRINKGVIGVYATVLGNTTFAHAGLSESEARQKRKDIVIGEAEAPNRHPGVMPEADNLKVKLVFDKSTSKILGGQVMGPKSSGELINVISVCIRQEMTVEVIALFPMGTHPALTASPIAYQITNAAEMAIQTMRDN
jgi:pyruvate/2-oxoglutarate dehydrogenase complex dihydrolipoamide dehydrogenase (E3) component